MQAFFRCRRAWNYQSPNRQSLQKIGISSPALHIGSAVHYALAVQAEGGDPFEAVGEFFFAAVAEYVARYRKAVGAEPSSEEIAVVVEAETTVLELIRRYFARYSMDAPLGPGWRYVAVEQTFAVPIPGTDGVFKGTYDGIARDPKDRLWVVDHKTFSQAPDPEKIQLDMQFVSYAWAAHALFGEPVEGLLYDGIAKALPKPPEVLKKGGLSQAYYSTIDYVSYCDAIDAHGLDFANYSDILNRLRERDEQSVTPFYARRALRFPRAQIDDFVAWLPGVYREMAGDPAIYPVRPYAGCWDCTVKDLCDAQTFGEDVEWLIQTRYHTGAGSQSLRIKNRIEVEVDAAAFA